LSARSGTASRPRSGSITGQEFNLLPGTITIDGRPITGSIDINATDFAFAGRIYPKPGHEFMPEQDAGAEWDEAEDVEAVAV
jgi:hypothetical protein